MIIRIDLPIEKNIHSPALSYFIRDDCLYAYESCKFFTHSLAEICYIIHGKGHLKVNDYVFELNSGDLYILNPYVKHCEFLQKDRQEGFSYYILGIVNFKLQPDNATVFRPLPLSEKSNIVFLLDKIFAELKSQLPAHDEAAKKYFELLLIEIERLYSSRIEPAPFIQSDLTAQIQSYIDVNYAGELSSKSIAEHFGRKLTPLRSNSKKPSVSPFKAISFSSVSRARCGCWRATEILLFLNWRLRPAFTIPPTSAVTSKKSPACLPVNIGRCFWKRTPDLCQDQNPHKNRRFSLCPINFNL